MRLVFFSVLVPLLLASCRCGNQVNEVPASLTVAPTGLDFGKVKVGASKQLTVSLESVTRAQVALSGIRVEGPAAAAYRVSTPPTEIEALGMSSVTVTFRPSAVAAFTASLVIESNDPDRPSQKVALVGEGALGELELTLDCQTARQCRAAVTQSPPDVDFGAAPLRRAMNPDPTTLPTVVVANLGAVPLVVTGATFGGNDPEAFSIAGNVTFPDGGVVLNEAEGFNLPLRFTPTDAAQASYAGTLTLTSDDPQRPSVEISLRGTLAPNTAPTLCANLTRVTPPAGGDLPRDYGTSADWSALLTPPAAGYDFSATRDVRPNELVTMSALSEAANLMACTTDAEDGRAGLTFQWRLTQAPRGAEGLAISGAATSQVQLRPTATGRYTVELAVTDSAGARVVTTLTFSVAVKRDFVAQLEWSGFSKTDLDLHLVRPSSEPDAFDGVFTFFTEGTGTTSGDLNGYAKQVRDQNAGAGFNFDWGQPGAADDPVLTVDDVGDGPLIENIALNSPENDAPCATATCTYRLYVHYFGDARGLSPAACEVDGGAGCTDGARCDCASADERCVAQSAPASQSPTGSGKCYPAPQPVVRLFFRGAATPAAVIPLEGLSPPDVVRLGAPCQLWHVADVRWPSKSSIGSLPDGGTPPPVVLPVGESGGRITPRLARFGQRAAGGSLRCAPDSTRGGVDWYARQPL